MSANRSVQAAQRRRAGPTNDAPIPGRGPQPSINSSQMFSSQAQSQSMSQKSNTSQNLGNQQKTEGLSSVSKMTIPQAITLITLRLGILETKIPTLLESRNNIQIEGHEDMVLVDNNVIQNMSSRLESLEKRSTTSAGTSASGPEINLLKQQFETLKQSIVQSKSATATLVKDNKDLKVQVDNLNRELNETKELLNALQNLTMDNSQKILDMSINMGNDSLNDLDSSMLDNNMLDNNMLDNNMLDNLDKNMIYNEVIGHMENVDISQLHSESNMNELIQTAK